MPALAATAAGFCALQAPAQPSRQSAPRPRILAPEAITFGSNGELYFSDCNGQRIFRIGPAGRLTIVAGHGAPGLMEGTFSGDGGPATKAELSCPSGLAFDHAGNLYFADHENQRIRRIDTKGKITTYAGSGLTGYGAGGYAGDGGPAARARLSQPVGLTSAPDGSLLIADGANDRIRRITPDGRISTVKGSAGILAPEYIVVTRNGALDVSAQDANRIYQITRDGQRTTIAGTGQRGFSGDGAQARSAKLSGPYGLALDRAGNLYVSETIGNRVRKIDPHGIIQTVAGTGRPGFRGDAGPATRAQLKTPFGIATDTHGNLYIADGGNGRVREVDTRGIIKTIAGGH